MFEVKDGNGTYRMTFDKLPAFSQRVQDKPLEGGTIIAIHQAVGQQTTLRWLTLELDG
jgi:hypothetical protein